MMEDLSEFYSASARVMSRSLIRELLKLTRRGGIISFAGGLPDPSTFPVEELKAITTQVLERESRLALQYGPTEGDARLRDELVRWMAKDGIRATSGQVLITIGSQQGLDLVGRVFLDPGDVIVVERPSYMAALKREMPPGVSWTHPHGGLFLWVRLPEGMDTEQLLRPAIEEEGVAYVVGSGFHADGGGENTMRLNFSYPSEKEIEEGISRLASLVKKRVPKEVTA